MSHRYRGRHCAVPTRTITTPRVAGAGIAAAGALTAVTPAVGANAAQAAAAPAVAKAAATPAAATATFRGIVKKGDRGTTVRNVQSKVKVSRDGIFGNQTKGAVKKYQRSHGLAADGIVGPRTGSKMGLRSGSTGTASRSGTRSTSSTLGTAARYTGIPYRYGGTNTAGFDCSGYTQYVFKKHGINLPRTAEAQRQATTRVSSPRAGDLVFFGAPAYHVGIYAGNGKMYDAGRTGLSSSKRSIWTSAVSYGRA